MSDAEPGLFLSLTYSLYKNLEKEPNWRRVTPLARTLSTHQQSQGLVLLREIKVNLVLFAAAPSKNIAS